MNKAQHTSGPWFLTSESDTVHGYSAEGEALIVVYELGTNEADACLIGAAPELLEALRRTTEMCEGYAEWIKRNVMSADIEQHPYLPELDGATEDARAAIAKATGATP